MSRTPGFSSLGGLRARLAAAAATFALALGGGALAAPATVRQLEAHVHGVGQVGFVADGQTLVAEIETPLANLVGFEHAPETPEERKTYDDAVAWLARAENLFDFGRVRCTLSGIAMTAPDFGADEAGHGSGHADGEAHDHDHDHDHTDDDHAHEAAVHAHADVRVEYSFACPDLDRLSRIGVRLFDRFPGFERIDAVFVGERSYTESLTPDDATMELR